MLRPRYVRRYFYRDGGVESHSGGSVKIYETRCRPVGFLAAGERRDENGASFTRNSMVDLLPHHSVVPLRLDIRDKEALSRFRDSDAIDLLLHGSLADMVQDDHL